MTFNHLALLEKYRATQTGNGWHTAPDDGYLYDHLAFHLTEAGLTNELAALFENSNWLHVRVAQGGYDLYLADLAIAWEVSYQEALKQIEAEEESSALIDCIHYAFIETSLRSWAATHTPSIIAQAVERKLWSPKRALSLAAIIPDERRRADLYRVLANTSELTREQQANSRKEALNAAQEIDFLPYQVSALHALAKETEGEQQHKAFADALSGAVREADAFGGLNGISLWQLIPELPSDLVSDALAAVMLLKNPEARAWALSAVAKRLPENEREALYRKCLDSVQEMQKAVSDWAEVRQANALAQFSSYLKGELAVKALEIALQFTESEWRPRAVAGLLGQLSPTDLQRALDSFLEITNQWWQADGLIGIVEHSRGDTQQLAFHALLSTTHQEAQTKIITWLMYLNSTELIETLLALSQQLGTENTFSASVFDLLVRKQQAPAFDRVPAVQPKIEVPLEDSELERILAIEYEEERCEQLRGIARRLPTKLLTRALEAAFQFEDTLYRDWAFEALAKYLTDDLIQTALEGRFDYEDLVACNSILNAWAIHTQSPAQDKLLAYALARLRRVQNLWWRLEQLDASLRFRSSYADQVASTLFETAIQLPIDATSLWSLANAVEYLAGEQRARALDIVQENVWTYEKPPYTHAYEDMEKYQRIRILGKFLEYLEGDQKADQLEKSLELLLTIQESPWLGNALDDLSRHLADKHWPTIMKTLLPQSQGYSQARLIGIICEHIPEAFFDQLLQAAQEIAPQSAKAEALIALASHTSDQSQRATLAADALEMFLNLQNTDLIRLDPISTQDRLLHRKIGLFLKLAQIGVSAAIAPGVAATQSLSNEIDRAGSLMLFIPFLHDQRAAHQQIVRGFLAQLKVLRAGNRAELYWNLSPNHVLQTPIISPQALTQIAENALQVLQNWRWT